MFLQMTTNHMVTHLVDRSAQVKLVSLKRMINLDNRTMFVLAVVGHFGIEMGLSNTRLVVTAAASVAVACPVGVHATVIWLLSRWGLETGMVASGEAPVMSGRSSQTTTATYHSTSAQMATPTGTVKKMSFLPARVAAAAVAKVAVAKFVEACT